jgi:hypothetical protein
VGLSLSLKSKNQPFTYTEIVSITNNFQTIIREGGFGKVYLGNLNDGRQVAVKLLSQSSRQGYCCYPIFDPCFDKFSEKIQK